MNEPGRWSHHDQAVDAVLQAGLDNRTLYVNITTSSMPEGAARGQLVTAQLQLPADPSAFMVDGIDPPTAATVTTLPAHIVAMLNRAPLPASVTPKSVSLEASGNDGSFDDGNETFITPASVGASDSEVVVSLAGVQVASDVYRVSLTGSIIVANRMSLGGPWLRDEWIALIRSWVEEGAQDN